MSEAVDDVLSGAFGAPVNRPQLNAFVANSQATNGLKSAQTMDALAAAQKAINENQAAASLKDAYVKATGDTQGADLYASTLIGHFGTAEQAAQATGQFTKNKALTTLADPTQLGTPGAVAAGQVTQGKPADPFTTVPNQYAPTPGVPTPPVVESPQGQSEIALRAAQANAANTGATLHTAQANTTGTGLTDDALYNAAVRYNQFGVMPPLGRDMTGQAHAKVLQYAAILSAQPGWVPDSFKSDGTAPAPGTTPATTPAPQGTVPGVGGGPPPLHPSLATATATAANPSANKASTAALADMTKRAAVADSSEATTQANLGVVQHYMTDLDPSGAPLWNKIQYALQNNLAGDHDLSAFQTSLTTARDEYARVISMATGAQGITDSARAEGLKLFPDNLSPAMFKGSYDAALQDMSNRTASLHSQIAAQKHNLFTPGAQAPDAAAPAAPLPAASAVPGPSIAHIANDDDYSKLPSGAKFVGPDGQLRQKP